MDTPGSKAPRTKSRWNSASRMRRPAKGPSGTFSPSRKAIAAAPGVVIWNPPPSEPVAPRRERIFGSSHLASPLREGTYEGSIIDHARVRQHARNSNSRDAETIG